jgi:hypothetical protein
MGTPCADETVQSHICIMFISREANALPKPLDAIMVRLPSNSAKVDRMMLAMQMKHFPQVPTTQIT